MKTVYLATKPNGNLAAVSYFPNIAVDILYSVTMQTLRLDQYDPEPPDIGEGDLKRITERELLSTGILNEQQVAELKNNGTVILDMEVS